MYDRILRSFMRRVHAEIMWWYLLTGIREKLVLLLLCATSRDLPGKHNRRQDVVVQKMDAYKICFIPVFNRGVA